MALTISSTTGTAPLVQASLRGVRRANDVAKTEGEAAVALIESTAAATRTGAATAPAPADGTERSPNDGAVGSRISLRV
jgi:hypothetical protein